MALRLRQEVCDEELPPPHHQMDRVVDLALAESPRHDLRSFPFRQGRLHVSEARADIGGFIVQKSLPHITRRVSRNVNSQARLRELARPVSRVPPFGVIKILDW